MDENKIIKILFVEDMDADFELAENELLMNKIDFLSLRVENGTDFLNALKEFKPDIVISDYSLPEFNGMDALKILKENDESIPFIILTGTLNEETAVDCIKAGATDYVIKEHIGKLPFAFKEALRYRDIMRKKIKAEAALLDSEARYRSMFENNYAIMMLIDPVKGSIIDVNPAAADYYGLSRQELSSRNLSDISGTETVSLNDRLSLSLGGRKKHFLARHILHNHEERDVEIFYSPVNYSGKTFAFWIVQDVTERNKALEDLKRSLNEKKELIMEIYHRTKNSMQVIISMLALQSMFIGNKELEDIFQKMESRIRVMSLVHEKLYQTNNMSKLNLKEYLTDLINNIMTEYEITGEKISITDKMEKTDVLIDSATPCGLIVNELVTNVVKHAFPGENGGKLIIGLSKDKSGVLELVISDNGAGKGVNIDINNSISFGLTIVKNLVEYQLKGTMKLDNTAGIKWTIKFKDNIYEERV